MPKLPTLPPRLTGADPEAMARQFSAGRTLIAASMLAAPVPAARLLGLDSATAKRVGWLTRMMAVRDGALGVGGLDALRRDGDARPWLLGGAVSDAVDAAVIAGALSSGRLKGVLPTAIAVGAAGLAALGVVNAARLR
ncbi:MAG TPA: hypothetical protein VGN18_03735 [Jatrophihabitans sp.]|jgi:hypothetical protein|uniref:hypothetical protein n=1 Tax=Jatrophihabitans sp. TaxID=1932789 RepID=UPI002E03DF31|nr:hypothetical protein [Jatrophihabitans sp.]